MAAVEEIRAKEELASVAAKLDGARKENEALGDEVNKLKNRVVELQDASITEVLKDQVADLEAEVALLSSVAKQTADELDKAKRDLQAAGPALALVEALKAV